eukprot:846042-Pelagomonas_calceolata.AAC.2
MQQGRAVLLLQCASLLEASFGAVAAVAVSVVCVCCVCDVLASSAILITLRKLAGCLRGCLRF